MNASLCNGAKYLQRDYNSIKVLPFFVLTYCIMQCTGALNEADPYAHLDPFFLISSDLNSRSLPLSLQQTVSSSRPYYPALPCSCSAWLASAWFRLTLLRFGCELRWPLPTTQSNPAPFHIACQSHDSWMHITNSIGKRKGQEVEGGRN